MKNKKIMYLNILLITILLLVNSLFVVSAKPNFAYTDPYGTSCWTSHVAARTLIGYGGVDNQNRYSTTCHVNFAYTKSYPSQFAYLQSYIYEVGGSWSQNFAPATLYKYIWSYTANGSYTVCTNGYRTGWSGEACA